MSYPDVPPLHVLALVKQIPAFESMRLGEDGRLVREGLPLEMSAYDRRAVAQGVALVEKYGGSFTVVTMGPPSAEDVVREALAYATQHDVEARGVIVSDPAMAGSDTLATARALAATIRLLGDPGGGNSDRNRGGGPIDLVLVGRNSVDADTGQVGPQLAQLLDLPFATGVKQLELRATGGGSNAGAAASKEVSQVAEVGCEHDDVWIEATVRLPAVLSTAERLIDPCKIKDPAAWAEVDPALLRLVRADELGPGPWGAAGSPTAVGEIRQEVVERDRRVLDGDIAEQVRAAVDYLEDHGLLRADDARANRLAPLPAMPTSPSATIAVVIEPGRDQLAFELLCGAARLAQDVAGRIVAFGPAPLDARALRAYGVTRVVELTGAESPEDVATALSAWIDAEHPWAVLAGSTAWGREVAARASAAVGAGLTGDAVGLAVDAGRLVAWKPAFGGSLVAAIRSSSPVQMATVRPGLLTRYEPRSVDATDIPSIERLTVEPRRRVIIREQHREDDSDALANAQMVIGVGQGVEPDRYHELDGLRSVLHAELAATRKVTDNGWLPRARQLGITGHSIAPLLYVAIGMSGKYNHTVGVRSAGTILAINPDPEAPIFSFADVGIVGAWDVAVPELERQLRARLGD